MDIKQILISNGIAEDVASTLKDLITKDIHTDFIPKVQYQKKISELDTIKTDHEELKAEHETLVLNSKGLEKYKTNYDTLVTEFNNFKTDIETKETNQVKLSKIKESLKSAGFNEKIIPLLTKEFDLSKIEIEDNEIQGWEDLSKGIKEEYAPFISTQEKKGAEPSKPPIGGGSAELPLSLGEALKEKFSK